MITLKTERLAIQIQEPGGSYQRSRFDWSGICQQITLDGAARNGQIFCSQEATKDDPGTEGVGLIDEFGIVTPIGYQEIGVGEWFPKIGVGFLQKTSNELYDFMQDYPIRIVPFKVEQSGDAKIIFIQESNLVDGWGWKLIKTLCLDGASLTIQYMLENIGEKPIATEQYNHNFIAINGKTIGPNYQLRTSFPIDFELVDWGIKVTDNLLNLTAIPSTYISARQSDCAGIQNVEWELTHIPTNHGLRVTEQISLFQFALWAKSYVISPEFFVWIDLQPGESKNWQREYTFF